MKAAMFSKYFLLLFSLDIFSHSTFLHAFGILSSRPTQRSGVEKQAAAAGEVNENVEI